MRQPLVAGNWKMHGSTKQVAALLGDLVDGDTPDAVGVVVFPTYVHLNQALDLCRSSRIEVGAQDCSHEREGAFTGEVAAPMLAELGCQWVIIGHSERRAYHGEDEQLLAQKLLAAAAAGLKPILCVGETREQREAGDAESVVGGQLRGALANQDIPEGLVIAYEPVWAIGTGLTATPQQAQDMHAFIRGELGPLGGDAETMRLLYGGSVKAGNAAELFAQADIDGALVGGAALVAEDFQAIVRAAVPG